MNSSKCMPEGLVMPEEKFPEDTPLAMAYVPYQTWGNTYPENVALEKGTIFEELYLPFCGKEGVSRYGK